MTMSASTNSDSILAYHFSRGVQLFFLQDSTGKTLEEASSEFLNVLMVDSSHAPAIAYLGLIFLTKQDTSLALSYFHKALLFDSACSAAHIGLARLHRLRGLANEQHRELQTAIRLDSNNLFARRELINSLLHGEEEGALTEEVLMEALPHLKYIVKFDTTDHKAHYDLAQSFEYSKQWDSALVYYQAALRFRKTVEFLPDVRYDVARCLENLKRFEDALAEYHEYLNELENTGGDDQILWVIKTKIAELQKRLNK
jgi:tetratricopeptide (TPR) repeat protein